MTPCTGRQNTPPECLRCSRLALRGLMRPVPSLSVLEPCPMFELRDIYSLPKHRPQVRA